ncbi:unnamed protein product, partial [Amoebophrya sp. A25]
FVATGLQCGNIKPYFVSVDAEGKFTQEAGRQQLEPLQATSTVHEARSAHAFPRDRDKLVDIVDDMQFLATCGLNPARTIISNSIAVRAHSDFRVWECCLREVVTTDGKSSVGVAFLHPLTIAKAAPRAKAEPKAKAKADARAKVLGLRVAIDAASFYFT